MKFQAEWRPDEAKGTKTSTKEGCRRCTIGSQGRHDRAMKAESVRTVGHTTMHETVYLSWDAWLPVRRGKAMHPVVFWRFELVLWKFGGVMFYFLERTLQWRFLGFFLVSLRDPKTSNLGRQFIYLRSRCHCNSILFSFSLPFVVIVSRFCVYS